MCTFNGETFLKEQLDSIKNQDYKNWKLYVSDDGSSDQTLFILKDYQKRWGKDKLHILKGPCKNFQSNFLSLITCKKIKADLYFLSDQDDIWLPHKLSHTIKKIAKFNLSKPILYCARTTYVSSNAKRFLGYSKAFLKPPSFKNALVQSIAGGNTMAFNNALKIIVCRFKEVDIISHDWWLYILNELSNGKTFYDLESTIFYRQHNRSQVGANVGLISKLRRIFFLLGGTFREYNSRHLDALNKIKIQSTAKNIRLINIFFIKRDKSLKERVMMIRGLGLYRQTFHGQIALYLAAILRKL